MRPIRPPIARKMTAATALALISVCAAVSTFSPVYWQVRNSASRPTAPTTVSAVMLLPLLRKALLGLGLLVRDVDLAGHGVVADAAEFVADDAECAALGRR